MWITNITEHRAQGDAVGSAIACALLTVCATMRVRARIGDRIVVLMVVLFILAAAALAVLLLFSKQILTSSVGGRERTPAATIVLCRFTSRQGCGNLALRRHGSGVTALSPQSQPGAGLFLCHMGESIRSGSMRRLARG
jgi:hypothetical protein